MKTINEIKKDIGFLGYEKEQKAERENLRSLILYLETNPTEEVLKKQQAKLQNRIEVINSRFPSWRNNNLKILNEFEARNKYNALNNLSKLNKQLSNINYLLS